MNSRQRLQGVSTDYGPGGSRRVRSLLMPVSRDVMLGRREWPTTPSSLFLKQSSVEQGWGGGPKGAIKMK